MCPQLACQGETDLIQRLSALLDTAYAGVEKLGGLLEAPAAGSKNVLTAGVHYRDQVIPAMNELRAAVDEMEQQVSAEYWPYPSYAELMYSI